MTGEPLITTLNAQKAVVAQHIAAVYMGAERPPIAEYVLDFARALSPPPGGFVGRSQVFAALDTFRAQDDRGFFDIVADAGLGKTALAAEIVRRYDAIAFFTSASRNVRRASQFLTHASAALILRYRLPYDHLPARAGEDATFLERVLAEAATSNAVPGAGVLIVVDALDEAERPDPEANPLLLPTALPAGVHIVVTRRAGTPLLTAPGTSVAGCVLRRDDKQQSADIETYLRQAAASQAIAAAIARPTPPISVEQFVRRLASASEGNFMYLSYVLSDIAAGRFAMSFEGFSALPAGLVGYYEQFWSQIDALKTKNWTEWNDLYQPVIARLGAAAEAVTAKWLGDQIGRSAD